MKGQYTQTLAEINRSLRAIQNQMNDLVDKMRKEDAKEQMLKTFYGVFSSGSPLGDHYIVICASIREQAKEYMNDNFGHKFGEKGWYSYIADTLDSCYKYKPLKIVTLD